MTTGAADTDLQARDAALLRAAIALSAQARAAGDHPYGALLAAADGRVLLEARNTQVTTRDCTAHAETNLVRQAGERFDRTTLAAATAYASGEPCPMCAGAIYWAGIGRVVFGQTERDLKAQTGAHEENPTLDLPCHIVFEAGQRPTEIVGPLLADEAAQLQADFWDEKG
jgi:tRNA(Arg) A34 adenosine deaminase TadA